MMKAVPNQLKKKHVDLKAEMAKVGHQLRDAENAADEAAKIIQQRFPKLFLQHPSYLLDRSGPLPRILSEEEVEKLRTEELDCNEELSPGRRVAK